MSPHPIQQLEKGCYLETRGLLGGKVPALGEEAHGKCSYSATLPCQKPITSPQLEGYVLGFFWGAPGLLTPKTFQHLKQFMGSVGNDRGHGFGHAGLQHQSPHLCP